jgi:hypothetical protein
MRNDFDISPTRFKTTRSSEKQVMGPLGKASISRVAG